MELRPNFESCEDTNHRHRKNMLDLQKQEICDEKFPRKSLHILEDGASGVQVGDI